MADDINNRLADYGKWLDNAAHEYLQVKESGVIPAGQGRAAVSGRAARVLGAVAATVALVTGSFVVNQVGGSTGSHDVAFAWSATAVEASDTERTKVIDACTQAQPDIAQVQGTDIAVDVRGSLGTGVYVAGTAVTVCVVELNRDAPGARVLERTEFPASGHVTGARSANGVQIANIHMGGHEITVVWGRDTELPADCRNLDVFTSKGVIRALRAKGVFAFWYPGQSTMPASSPGAIQYGCAASGDRAPTSTVAGADPYGSLCFETLTVLNDHGITGKGGRVINMGKWDASVHDEFQHKLWPIAEVFMPGPGVPLSAIYSAWTGVNEGLTLSLDSAGMQRVTDRPAVEKEVSKAIDSFVALCNGPRPEDNPNPVTSTTIEIREMNPAVQSTVLPG